MRASDFLDTLFGALLSEPPIPPLLADLPRPIIEQPAAPWTLETPLLRRDVASLERWLDLNA
jgi:hypothetical protein